MKQREEPVTALPLEIDDLQRRVMNQQVVLMGTRMMMLLEVLIR